MKFPEHQQKPKHNVLFKLTRWYLKNVVKETHVIPMWLSTLKTLVADVPATRILKLSNKFPAAIFFRGKEG